MEIEVVFENAIMTIRGGQLYLKEGKQITLIADEDAPVTANSNQQGYWGNSHGRLIRAFYNSVLEGKPEYNVSAEEGIKTMKLIDALYKSSASGRRIQVEV